MEFTVSVPPAIAYGEDEAPPATGVPRLDVLVAVQNLLKGRVGTVARGLGWSESTLQKKISGQGAYVFSVRDLDEVQRYLGEVGPTQALAAGVGHVCVQENPIEVVSLPEGMSRMLQAMGDFAAALSEANPAGRGVSANALRRVRHCEAELLGTVNALGAFVAGQVAPRGGVL